MTVHTLNQIYQKQNEGECLEERKKKYQKVVQFLLIVQKSFILFYPSTRLVGNFLRLPLHSWHISSVIKPNIYVSWTQNAKGTVADTLGSIKGTAQITVCIMSPYHTKLNWLNSKRTELPPYLIMVSVSVEEIISLSKLFGHFLI